MVRRVVVTGIGLISPLGINVKTSWDNLIQSKSGISSISSFDTNRLACKIAGQVPRDGDNGFKLEDFIDFKDAKTMDVFIQYGVAATAEAIHDSGWANNLTQEQLDRTGVIIGSGIGGLRMIEKTSIEFHNSTSSRVSPYFIPSALINLVSGHVSIKYGFTGPNHSVVTACATGAHAIGDAMRIIKYGDADVMIAGGAEAAITPVGIVGFASAKALSTRYNDSPSQASRPWDQGHDGFVIGEGAGVVVLEEYEHAKKRGAKIYCELVGYGLTGDAYHITSPHPEGRGARRAMENALKDAKLTKEDIHYINAHGTSTPVGDIIELQTVQSLFAGQKTLAMSSTKSAIGHLLGAAGSVEFIFSLLAIRDQIAPPTLNLDNPLPEVNMNLIPHHAIDLKIDHVMSNSFGFGGTNVSLILKKLSN